MSMEIRERWRKPAELLSDDWEYVDVYVDSSGQRRATPHFVFTQETVERFRLGYLCISCQEPFEAAFPEECPVCRFPVRSDQTEIYNRAFKGETRLGPTYSLGDIREQDLGTKGMPNIWLPNGHRR